MKKDTAKIKISYYTTKYLDSISDTRSMNKIEKIVSANEEETTLSMATAIFSYHNEKNINPFKHPHLFLALSDYKKFITECELKFKNGLFEFSEDCENDNETIKSVMVELNDLLSFKNRNKNVKEITRLATEKIIKTYKISLSALSSRLKNKKVDTSNLHKFIVKKDYSKISMETIDELNEIVKEINEYMKNNEIETIKKGEKDEKSN